MSDTLKNVPITANTWIDLYAITGIPVGQRITVENVGVSDIYLAVQATQPPLDHDAYNVIKRGGPRLVNNPGDLGAWALSPNTDGLLNIAVAGGFAAANDSGDAFRLPVDTYHHVSVSQLKPLVQATAQYGINSNILECLEILGGTCTEVDSNYEVHSGTDPNGIALLLTVRQLLHKAMQGLLTEFSAVFDTPVVDNQQRAGLIINTDGISFGFRDTTFGIFYEHDGKTEIQELTITTEAAGSETATVTVSDMDFSVPLTAGSVEHNAFEIATSLNDQVGIESAFTSDGATVVSRSLRAQPQGAFAFSSATAVGAWVQQIAGVVSTNTFFPQTEWTVNTKPNLNPLTGNTYAIRFQYGYGIAEFFIANDKTGEFELVHTISSANNGVVPLFTQPTFRLGWASLNQGNTTDVVVKGASMAAFLEGAFELSSAPRSVSEFTLGVSPTSLMNLVTLRNRIVFGDKRNRAEVVGLVMGSTTDSNKGTLIQIIRGATITGDLIFSYIDKQNSIVEIATDGGDVTGGQLLRSFVAPASGAAFEIDLSFLAKALPPGEIVTIAGQPLGGAAADVTTDITFQEDF